MTRPPTGAVPDAPGSYQFVDRDGRVLYVGKAKSLRQRLNSYFQDPAALAPRTAQMVGQADHVEWMVVDTESEALLLEHNLIKRLQPRFNVRLKDDKSYPWLAVTVNEEWPRPAVVRGRKRKGVRYFGPYPNVGAIRETLDLLLRTYPVRTCSDNKFNRHQRLGRPCLLFHIERCSGPCVGAVEHEELRPDGRRADGVPGRGHPGDRARARDGDAPRPPRPRVRAGARCSGTSSRPSAAADAVRQMELERPEDFDVVGLAEDELEAAVQVFHVRSGKVVGRLALFVDKVEDLTDAGLIGRVLVDVYADAAAGVPRQVLVPTLPDDLEAVTAYLAERRGGPVAVRVPLRGPKRALQQTVEQNAKEAFVRHRLRRTSDHNSRARALESLQRELHLPAAPLRIECYDMSHLQGTDYVGSMVVFEDGLAKKSDYRHYKVAHRAGERRLRRHGGGPHPAAVGAAGRGGALRPGRRAGEAATGGERRPMTTGTPVPAPPPEAVRLPAPAAAPRRGPGPAPRGHEGPGRPGTDRPGADRLPGQAVRGGLPPGQLRPGPPAPPVRGPLPPPAAAGRGAPVRRLLPPDPAGQAHGHRRPRRDRRARARSAGPACWTSSAGWPPSGRPAATSSWRCRGSRPRWGRRCSTRIHTPMAPSGPAAVRAKVGE